VLSPVAIQSKMWVDSR